HERRAAAPAGLIRQGAALANDTVALRVALTSNNAVGLEEKLRSISTPGSPDFRQWISMDEVKAFVQPSPETFSAFNAFASANNLTSTVTCRMETGCRLLSQFPRQTSSSLRSSIFSRTQPSTDLSRAHFPCRSSPNSLDTLTCCI
ncbi:hypothetical protein DFH08DRAFT_79701, partial [Mycena albidolilacea]